MKLFSQQGIDRSVAAPENLLCKQRTFEALFFPVTELKGRHSGQGERKKTKTLCFLDCWHKIMAGIARRDVSE